jgi:hypothetical protein
MNKIIGISGVAGCGKDTFYSLLSEKIPCERFSLADALKTEVNQWCRMHYHIDSIDCDRDQKEIIRPFLVAHGATKRKLSEGRHWIEQLNDKIVKSSNSNLKIITDIRYDDYENDEASWVQEELGGTLVHISQYRMEDSERVYLKPANSEEARNDPKVKEKSDYQIEWEFIKNGQIYELEPFIDNFLDWLLSDHEKQKAMRQHFS